MRYQTLYTTIASGDVLSGVVAVQGAKTVGVFASIPTSCVAYIKVSYDVTSVNARRMTNSAGSGDWTWSVGSGMKAIDLLPAGNFVPYLRLETSVAQADTASLAVVVKL